MKIAIVAALGCLAVAAETISVPAGETMKVEGGRRFAAGKLVKDGAGLLDLTGAQLPDEGMEIREGAVRLAANGTPCAVTARHLRFRVTEARPAKPGAPDYGRSGIQFSEFRLFMGGKMLEMPKDAQAEGDDGSREGKQKGIDGNLKTKCFRGMPFVIHFKQDITFDAYSFATGNDAIGRDPRSWTLEAGFERKGVIHWVGLSEVHGFDVPKARCADIGTTFPVSLVTALAVDYPLTICGKGRLVLSGVHQALDACSGNGLVWLEQGAKVEFGTGSSFTGSAAGEGTACWRK